MTPELPADVWHVIARAMLPRPHALCVSAQLMRIVWEELKASEPSLPAHVVHFPPLKVDVWLEVRSRPQYTVVVALSVRRKHSYRRLRTFRLTAEQLSRATSHLDAYTTLRWRDPGRVLVVEFFDAPTLFVVSMPTQWLSRHLKDDAPT